MAETNENTTNATVTNLRPGHLYQFEVYALNKEGESIPTRTMDPIRAENPYSEGFQILYFLSGEFLFFLDAGPPSPPKDAAIVDFDHQSVTLRWTKPTDDGGRPITHYIIQKKDQFGGWFDALVTDNANCSATIDELEVGQSDQI